MTEIALSFETLFADWTSTDAEDVIRYLQDKAVTHPELAASRNVKSLSPSDSNVSLMPVKPLPASFVKTGHAKVALFWTGDFLNDAWHLRRERVACFCRNAAEGKGKLAIQLLTASFGSIVAMLPSSVALDASNTDMLLSRSS